MVKLLKSTAIFLAATLLFGSNSLLADNDLDEIPPVSCPISSVIKSIPDNISGIKAIEYDNFRWKIKTIQKVTNISDEPNDSVHTKNFIESEYILNTDSNELEPLGPGEFENDEHLPPSFSSLLSAIKSVEKNVPGAFVTSIEFDDGNWKVNALTGNTQTIPKNSMQGKSSHSETQMQQIMRYTVNPVNSVITSSEIDD